jgi:hypothetical protein
MHKNLFWAAGAALGLPILGMAMVWSVNTTTEQLHPTPESRQAAALSQSSENESTPHSAGPVSKDTALTKDEKNAAAPALELTAGPSSANSKDQVADVTTADLQKLATLVDFKGQLQKAKSGAPPLGTDGMNANYWVQALPKAEALLHSPCDCEQTNWLITFIQCGQYAMVGDPRYYQEVQLLDTLPMTNN